MKKSIVYIGVILYGIIASTLVGLYLQFIFNTPLTYLKEWLSTFRLGSDYVYYALYGVPMLLLYCPAFFIHIPLTKWEWSKHVHWSTYILPAIVFVFWILNAIFMSWMYDGVKDFIIMIGETAYLIIAAGHNIYQVVDSRKQ